METVSVALVSLSSPSLGRGVTAAGGLVEMSPKLVVGFVTTTPAY